LPGGSLNASDLTKKLSLEYGITDELAHAILKSITRIISETLQQDEHVLISGFGRFEVRHHGAVIKINPKTGQPIHVPAKKTMGFKPSKVLKDKISQ
jgi:nucleoid DNA-binding protein